MSDSEIRKTGCFHEENAVGTTWGSSSIILISLGTKYIFSDKRIFVLSRTIKQKYYDDNFVTFLKKKTSFA